MTTCPHRREAERRQPNRRTITDLSRYGLEPIGLLEPNLRGRKIRTPWNSCHRNARIPLPRRSTPPGHKPSSSLSRRYKTSLLSAWFGSRTDTKCACGLFPACSTRSANGQESNTWRLAALGATECRPVRLAIHRQTRDRPSGGARTAGDLSVALIFWWCWFGSAHRDRSSSDRTGSDETDESSNALSSAPCGRPELQTLTSN